MAAKDQGYDPDAFDSMAVVNAEQWNKSGPDGEQLTRADILPHGVSGFTKEQLGEAFLESAEHGATEVLRELHSLCGDDILHTVDSDLYTPLHRASYNGHVQSVEYLLSSGASVNSETVDGWTPLHCACRWNKAAVADLLIQNGAVMNAQTHGKQTPLHLASSNNRSRETLVLLMMNPDLQPELVNSQGDTAFDVAQRCGSYSSLFVMVQDCVDYRKFLNLPHFTKSS